MSTINFNKYSGAGNDFIVLDKSNNPDFELNPNLIQKICDRRNGIGADGVIFISDKPEFNFEMKYYNADGSLGSLCGNGARCALKYASVTNRVPGGKANFYCNDESYAGEIKESDEIIFHLHNPDKIKKEFKLKIFDQLFSAAFADTGSPHVVINITDVLQDSSKPNSCYNELKDFPVSQLGKAIRYHDDFAPEGANVNFIKLEEDYVNIRTYERGVEAETLACGTGSVAASVIAAIKYNYESPVKLKTFGGDQLLVTFERRGEEIYGVTLTGPAKQIFKGEIIL